jgi:hypothetical protein
MAERWDKLDAELADTREGERLKRQARAREMEQATRIRLAVGDTVPGIDREQHARLVERVVSWAKGRR